MLHDNDDSNQFTWSVTYQRHSKLFLNMSLLLQKLWSRKKYLWVAYTVTPSVALSGRTLTARIETWSGSEGSNDDSGICVLLQQNWTASKSFSASSTSARGWVSFNVAPNPVVIENWVRSSCKKTQKIIFSDIMWFISDEVGFLWIFNFKSVFYEIWNWNLKIPIPHTAHLLTPIWHISIIIS